MKALALSLAAALCLVACGQDGQDSAISSTTSARPSINDQDSKAFIAIFKRAGVQEQSSIETTFLTVPEAFCVAGNAKFCQFAVGGGLFVRANAADSEAFIQLIRKNGAVSKAVANGKRWDLKDFECSTRFDLATRHLLSSCSFRQ